MSRASCIAATFLITLLVGDPTLLAAPRQMEQLGRGVVAVSNPDGGVFVGWRLLSSDARDVAFNVYRSADGSPPVRINDRPLAGPTHFIDKAADAETPNRYFVRAITADKEGEASGAFTLSAAASHRPYLSLPLQTPAGYRPNDASVGDLDGDGEYEIVLHQSGRGRDNSQRGLTDPPVLQAYKLDGHLLWTIRLGRNIREGAHYTQFLVYDFDGDGRAEVACKTSDGTTDGLGKVIGDESANHVNADGHVLRGPEFLTVFDGLSGAALATVPYVPARTENHPENPDLAEYKTLWGDDRANRGERYLAAVAYLDGLRPSLVMCRGYYARTALAAWDFRDGKLTRRWLFDTGADPKNPFFGQGNHNLSVADVDADGRDEIVYGGMCVDDDGRGLWSSGLGHGDALHVGDLDPQRPGLEVFRIQERFDDAGAHMLDARTGEVLWRKPSVKANAFGRDRGEGPGRGVAFDVDPRYPGSECWAVGAGMKGMWDARGKLIGDTRPGSCNFAVWWDGDPLRELLDRNRISKWNWDRQTAEILLTAEGSVSANGTKATPCLSADILGDWREEVVWASERDDELRIYTTTIPTALRVRALMQDPQYRLGVASENVAYNQPPHLSGVLIPIDEPPATKE
jgi:rhamnogalacturonan endolyase